MNYREQSVDGFLSAVASTAVTPAGGTVAAIAGAAGASLCEMVCIHTVEREASTEGAAGLDPVGDDLRRVRERLLTLADADAAAVETSLAAGSDDRTETRRATGVPLAVAEACLVVLDHATVVTEHGNRNAVPDAVAGAFLAHAALRASAFTVRNNLDRTDDASFAEEVRGRIAEVERAAESAASEALATAERRR